MEPASNGYVLTMILAGEIAVLAGIELVDRWVERRRRRWKRRNGIM